MVAASYCETLRILRNMNFNVPHYDALYSENCWRDTSIVFNLGINTSLSRKLLTSKSDRKIDQTIVIFSGQRLSAPQNYELSV